MAQTKTDVSNSSNCGAAIVCSIAAIFCRHLLLLDYCDVIASLSLDEKQNGSQQKQNGNFIAPIICYKVDNSITEQIIAIFRYFMV